MNKDLSKTPSLLIDSEKNKQSLIDEVAVKDSFDDVAVERHRPIRLIFFGAFFLILFFLLSKLLVWNKGEVSGGAEEIALFSSSHLPESERSTASIASTLLQGPERKITKSMNTELVLVELIPKRETELFHKPVKRDSYSQVEQVETTQELLTEESLLAELLEFVRQKEPEIRPSENVLKAKKYEHIRDLAECPAANTKAGMLCRRQLCLVMADEIAECAKASEGS